MVSEHQERAFERSEIKSSKIVQYIAVIVNFQYVIKKLHFVNNTIKLKYSEYLLNYF